MSNNIYNFFITKQIIPQETKLKYLITIPCVNREERNAVNVIHKTFLGFENSGLFTSGIFIHIVLFESGSKDLSYLDFIQEYKDKYKSIIIQIIPSKYVLNGISNTLRMFEFINILPTTLYDFILWMDDDVYVSNNFIKNTDIWVKKYANFSIFSSLYVPYRSFPIKNKTDIKLSNIHEFYGTCAVIFKPLLAKYVIPHWYDRHFQQFSYNPDTRFRDSVRKQFPDIKKICVSEPSIVQHMNIGSAIKEIKSVSSTNKGHTCNNFIGEDNDPNFIF
jgi:hypothetical protein